MKDLVQSIFSQDERIRYCAVVDSEGRVIEGGMRPGVGEMEPSHQTSMILMRASVIMSMFSASEDFFGSVIGGVVVHERIAFIGVPLDKSRFVLVTTTPEYIASVEGMLKLLNQWGARRS